MRALFANRSLVFALVAGAVVSICAFATFHHVVSPVSIEGAPVAYAPPILEHMQTTAKALAADAIAGTPLQLRTQASVSASRVMGEGPAQGSSSNELRLLPPPPRGRGPSQLIRTANVSLDVTDVGRSLRDATLITDDELGDVTGLNDDAPSSPDEAHTATMAIRVPQYRFEQTLDALGRLGKVTNKSISAQDVSDQLIDAQARLRNLRRTEMDMLGIMDRSGNIDQVLIVTQQISSVREQIEQLDAQIQGMQYQVAYSTINISFTSPVVVTTPTGWGLLGLAWKNATSAARDFGISLVSCALWLLAFTPYLLVVGIFAWLLFRRVRAMTTPSPKTST